MVWIGAPLGFGGRPCVELTLLEEAVFLALLLVPIDPAECESSVNVGMGFVSGSSIFALNAAEVSVLFVPFIGFVSAGADLLLV